MYGLDANIDVNAFYASFDCPYWEKVEEILFGLFACKVSESDIEIQEFPYMGKTRILVKDVLKYEIGW